MESTKKEPAFPGLFQKANNSMIQALIACKNRLIREPENSSRKLTRQELIEDLPFNASDHYAQSCHIVNAAFDFKGRIDTDGFSPKEIPKETQQNNNEVSKDANAEVCLPQEDDFTKAEIPFLLTPIEKRWLKTFLLTDEASFLLDTDLHKTLKELLKDITPFDYSSSWHRTRFTGDDISEKGNQHVLRLLWQALFEQKEFKLKDADTQSWILLRLCYDERANRYSILATKDKILEAPQRFYLEDLKHIVLLPTTISQKERDSLFDEMLKMQQASVSLHLKDEYNARERCYALFAGFNKVSFTPKPGIYYLKVYFYRFDREDVIARILSLGSTVQVMKEDFSETSKTQANTIPSLSKEIREEIIERLKAARRYYEAF